MRAFLGLLFACLLIIPSPGWAQGSAYFSGAYYKVAPPVKSPVGLTNWKACVKAAKAGTGGCAIALDLGDSTSQGWYVGDLTQTKVYQTYLRLKAAGLPVIYDWYCGLGDAAGDTGTGGGVVDARAVLGTGWSLQAYNLGGLCPGWSAFSATSDMTFTPSDSIDTCDVYYIQGGDVGVATINFDGGTTLATISTSGPSAPQKVTISTTLGKHTVHIVPVSGNTYYQALDCYPLNGNKIRVLHMGWEGSLSVDWTTAGQQGAGSAYSAWAYFGMIQPSLGVVNLGINDWEDSTGTTTFGTNLASIQASATSLGGMDIVYEFPHSTGATATEATQLTYGAVITTQAGTTHSLFSPRAYMGPWASVNAASETADTYHYNVAGQAQEANIEASVLIAAAH